MSDASEPLRAPERLNDSHHLDAFASGAPTLDAWLKRKARANQVSGASRTYVLCRGTTVVGLYALAAGSIQHEHLPRKLKQNMPDPIPVIVLGRLAIDATEQGHGLGRAMLRRVRAVHMSTSEPNYITVETRRIATLSQRARTADAPGFLWLPGLKSEMISTKATALAGWCDENGYACTRLDYSGHGRSDGRFEDGTIGAWLEEARVAFDTLTTGPQVLVGSSTGGYIALLLLRNALRNDPARASRISGLALIAPAWDLST